MAFDVIDKVHIHQVKIEVEIEFDTADLVDRSKFH